MPSILNRPRIGLIGVGALVHAFAQRLATAGMEVVAYDMNPSERSRLGRLGVRIADSPSEATDKMSRVLVCLPNQKLLTGVLKEIAPSLSPNQTVIDTTPANPDESQQTRDHLAASNLTYLHACVMSRSDQVRHGQGLLLVSGEHEVFEQCSDLWPLLGASVLNVGPHGNGERMKQVSDLVLGLNRAVLAEGMVLARKFCLDPVQVLEVLRTTMAYSRVMDITGEKMLQGDFSPRSTLSQQLVQVREMINTASAAQVQLVLSEAHQKLLELAEQKGCGSMDPSAVICAYDPRS